MKLLGFPETLTIGAFSKMLPFLFLCPLPVVQSVLEWTTFSGLHGLGKDV